MFSFQDTPGGSINPKDFWMENCNLNERYLWLNNQDIEPLWLRCRVNTSGSDSQKAQRMFHNLKAWFDLPLVAMCNNTKSAAKLVDGAPATIGTQYGVTISHMNSIVRAEFPNANFTTRPEMARSTRL